MIGQAQGGSTKPLTDASPCRLSQPQRPTLTLPAGAQVLGGPRVTSIPNSLSSSELPFNPFYYLY